jgi:hypothetical protein
MKRFLILALQHQRIAALKRENERLQTIRRANTQFELAGFGWLVTGRPGGGREFGDATEWKIAQPGQDRAQIVADGDFKAPTGFLNRLFKYHASFTHFLQRP